MLELLYSYSFYILRVIIVVKENQQRKVHISIIHTLQGTPIIMYTHAYRYSLSNIQPKLEIKSVSLL